jgi:hypothetical protein
MTTGMAVKAPMPYKHSADLLDFRSQSQSNPTQNSQDISIPADPVVIQEARVQQPPSLTSFSPKFEDKDNSGNEIVSHLQIPSSINNSKGSLAEFAAQV